MLLTNYFNQVFRILILICWSQVITAAVVKNKCGEYVFEVKILKGRDNFEKQYELYSSLEHQRPVSFYKTKSGVGLLVKCIKNKNNQLVLIFQEFCGGNGCPEDLYGVFDPRKRKILIRPANWPSGNYKQVEKLIGYSPPFLPGDNEAFCCFDREY